MAELRIKNIAKRYPNEFVAILDFSLDIEDKEFIIFVGSSGCGKSTMLRMIAGLEEISEGEILINGKKMNDVAPKDRDFAMVFQNYALYPHMSVYDNIAFGLKLRKIPKSEIKNLVHNAAKMLDIEDLLNRKPKELSGGQKQRVAIGRAVVRNPSVFLMDEPLSNLDAKLRTQMRIEISKLYQKLQTTFVYVTHDQTEAMTLGTRIVVLNNGLIQQVDSPQNLYCKPNNTFVAGFIGSPQMNFIDVYAINEDGLVYLTFGNKKIGLPEAKSKKIQEGNFMGKELIMGIRPEDIYEQPSSACSAENIFEANVEVSEMLGAEVFLYLNYKGEKLTVRVMNSHAKLGDKVTIALDLNKVHIFDKETGLTITN